MPEEGETIDVAVARRQGAVTIDARFRAGAGVTALFGRSGSGKTSIITMIAGLTRPEAGRIAIGGRVLFDSATGADVPPEHRRVGVVFQDGRLFPHLSVLGNLTFGWKRAPAAARTVSVEEVVAVLGIGPLLDRRPGRLSGGEKQRVAIGRALLAAPRLLLMDEPLAALDRARKAEVLPFIAGLSHRFAVPILYVSHAMDEVLRLADTLILIDDGRTVAVGPVEELLSRPDLRPLTGRYDAGSVVVATVAGHDPVFGVTRLAFGGGTLVTALVDLPVGTPTRVRVRARDIAIALDPPTRISVRNIVPAVISALSPAEGPLVDVMLDCDGVRLWAQVTALACADLGLAPGLAVHALIKAVSMSGRDVAGRR